MINQYTLNRMILSFLALSMWQCREPELNIPSYNSKIAVDGYIEVGHPPVLYLTYSSPFISNYDSLDFVDMVKFNVSAYIISEEGDTIGFTRQTNSTEFPPFKYTMSVSDLVGEAGKTYKLLIRKSGEEDITAGTSIPKFPPDIIDVTFEQEMTSDTLGRYCLLMNNQNQYYFIQNKEYAEPDFYPVRFPAKSSRLFDSENLTFFLYYRDKSNLWLEQDELDSAKGTEEDVNASRLYHKNDTIVFKISSIDVGSYEVMSSIFLDTEFPDNPFKPISQFPVSNVSNGIGRWTGMNSMTRTVRGTP